MQGYVANTDYDWYSFLKSQTNLDEVNFWQPSGNRGFRAIEPGFPFFFKLKKPHYAIAGFGYLARTSILPVWLAWASFERLNGAPDFATMNSRIEKYRSDRRPSGQYPIGCLMISGPIFFGHDDWIDQPRDWKRNVVQGATYDLNEGEGRRIYEQCLRLAKSRSLPPAGSVEEKRYGEWFARPRLGQGSFRVAVLDAYGRACAVSREHSLSVLEAAHIKPYAESGPHEASNGLLLRADIHRLFERGYVTVTPEYRFEVSPKLKEEFENGKTYYPFHGCAIGAPRSPQDRPDPTLLDWHNRLKFRV